MGNNITENIVLHDKENCFVEGTVNVLFSEKMAKELELSLSENRPDSMSSEVDSILKVNGVTSYRRLFPDTGRFDGRKRREGLHRWYKITYDRNQTATRSYSDLPHLPGAEIISPERRIVRCSIFNDPKLNKQWHYYNDGSLSSEFVAGADINVLPVWDNYTTGNRSVIVAVLDGGVDPEHEDLAGNYAGGKNFGTGGKVTPDDHGTHVAGTISAVNNNGVGVAGIAGGDAESGIDGVGILSCQIFAGNNPFGAPEALIWAADNGAVIANNSWGYVFGSSEESRQAVISSELKAAIDYFIKYAGCDDSGAQLPDSPMKGGVVIFAAGNDSWDSNPIGAYEPVISVGAIGPDYSRAYYSNYGDWVDIAAPGGTAKVSSGQVLSTLPDNSYGEMQGTSMACPHVSGVAALIVSYYGGAGFTNEMLKERLLGGARRDILPMSAKIGPLVDALGSMAYGGTIAPEMVTDFDLNAVGNKVTVSLEVTEDEDDKKPYEYVVLITSDPSLLNEIDIDSLPEDVSVHKFRTGLIPVGEMMNMDIKNLAYEKDYYVCISARDYADNHSTWSEVKKITTGANNPPAIEPLMDIEEIVLKSRESFSMSFNIYDPEGGELMVSISKNLSGASLKKEGDVWKLNITASIAKPGIYEGEISAVDVENAASSYKLKYEILPNFAPEIIKDIDHILCWKAGESFQFCLDEYFYDQDEEPLTYKVVGGNKMVAKTSLDGNILNIDIAGFGSTSFTVSAVDAKNSSVSVDVKVAVKNPTSLLELYPHPVETVLNIRTGEPQATDIVIWSLSGNKIYEASSLTVSAFEPAVVDMTDYAPGKYKVKVSFAGNDFERVITKI